MPKPKVNFNRSVGAIAQKKANIERRVKEEEAEEVERLSIFKLKASEITILPELEKYIRKQSEDEAIQFKDSIKNEGIRDNLVITSIDGKNVLVDGHHRFRAGQEIGINDFSLKKIELASIDDIKLWMLKNQLGRRNLTDAERGDIALSITEFLTAKGLENKSKGGKNEDFANLQKVNSVKEASKIAGISEGNISKLKKLKKEAPEEVYSQVLAGEKSIHKAHTELKKHPKLKQSSLQGKLDVDGIRKEIKSLCNLSVPFLESAQFILSSFIKESIKDYRISKDYMKDVEEALEILNNSGILKDDVYVSRLEYFYNKTIKMIKNRMDYPDYHDAIDDFRERAHSAWDKYTEIQRLERKLSKAKEQAKS